MDARKMMRVIASAALLACCLTNASTATAADCSSTAASSGNGYVSSIDCASAPGSTNVHDASAGSSSSPYTEYRWDLACDVAVGAVVTCADWCPAGEMAYRLLGLRDGTWYPLGIRCSAEPPDAAATVTPAMVARAFQRIPLPALRAITQPADKTLINFDTIFRVEATPLHRTLNLLGQRVELAITPSTFRWVHGDGTTAVTDTPGAAYPAKEVVYRYQQAHVTVMHHVEIVWTARWSLNGGPFQDVDGTVTTIGPDTALRIAEATPALSGDGH
jgi:hypothetical protein